MPPRSVCRWTVRGRVQPAKFRLREALFGSIQQWEEGLSAVPLHMDGDTLCVRKVFSEADGEALRLYPHL